MATTNPTSPRVLETYTLLQIAAETLFGRKPVDPAVAPGFYPEDLDVTKLVEVGNLHSSRMTQEQAEKFVTEWKVISHQPNTATGFSATLFECLVDDPARGMSVGKLVISIRSTEFIEDSTRDSKATNELEIRQTGWAFGQIADMEAWWNSLPAWVREGKRQDPMPPAAVRAFSERLRASGLAPKAVVGACMHKLAVLIYGVLRSGVPFDPRIAMPRLDLEDGI